MVRGERGPERHFQCFAPLRQAWETMFDIRSEPPPTSITDGIFAASLRTTWGLLGLMSSDNQPWLYPKETHQPFLHAVLDAWAELDAVGPRYYSALEGRPLWAIPSNLHYVLANMGVPTEVLTRGAAA